MIRFNDAKQKASLYDIPMAAAILHERHIYDDSEESGLSVIKSEPKGKAAAEELRSLFSCLLQSYNTQSPEFSVRYI
jgi:chromosome partitioning protein